MMLRVTLDLVKCNERVPEKDGEYTVVYQRYPNEFVVLGNTQFTTEYGWNTSIYSDGTVSNEHRLNYEERDNFYWAPKVDATEIDEENADE